MAKKTVRKLIGVHFNADDAHLAYTRKGAASLKDEPYLLKSLEVEADSPDSESDTQAHACEDTIVDKSTTTNPNTKENEMTDVTQNADATAEVLKRMQQLEHELAVQKAVNVTAKYNFDAEIAEGVATAVASVDADRQEAIFKGFDALVAAGETAVTKAADAAKAEGVDQENIINKALITDKEAGAEETVEKKADGELTLAQKIAAIQDEGAK